MKKVISLIFAVIMLLSGTVNTYAVDNSREFLFELSVDGGYEKKVQPGDIITVVFTLNRTDKEEDYDMYAMQNEIRYDSEFFQLVEGSAMLSNGIVGTDIGLRDSYREFYMNFVSLSGGENWTSEKMIGSFQLKVIGDSGVAQISNQGYLVSSEDGKDSYEATCQDVTIILTTDCVISFETNGGSPIEDQTVIYGEKVVRPDNPIREGYHLVGWYTDIDLLTPWDFDTDTVRGNMTLYAKWEAGAPIEAVPGNDQTGGFDDWWILPVLGLLVFLILLLIMRMNRKTVKFETNCNMKIGDQKVKKGGYAERPEEPKREGRIFSGWFCDAECTRRWDFEEDKVEDNMTLYAKWI